MKKIKFLFATTGILGVAALASCGPKGPTVEEAMAGFDSTLATTVKATYVSNYKVDIDANGGTGNMDSFKRNIQSTSTIEIDLGTDLYLYVSNQTKDVTANTTITTETLVYKDSDGKYYQTTSTTDKTEVTGLSATKLDEILKAATESQTGYVGVSSFLYNKTDLSYEIANFGLTTTFTADDLENPTYSVNKANGIDVTYTPAYIGYHTDNGWSDFHSTGSFTVKTNEKGQVVSYNEPLNASLDFAIMTPAPTVKISGERTLTAEYGTTLTKKTDVTHAASTVKYGTATNGTFTVKDLEGANYGTMAALADGATITKSGHYIVVTPKANDGYEIDAVKVNGNEAAVVANGMYCFAPAYGVNDITVTFKAKGAAAEKELKYAYKGTIEAGNGPVELVIKLYKDNTFDVVVPAFNNAKSCSGTYTVASDMTKVTLTKSGSAVGFTATSDTCELTFAGMTVLNTASFFGVAGTWTFNYQA